LPRPALSLHGGPGTDEFIDRLAHDLSSPVTTMVAVMGLLQGQAGERLDAASHALLKRGVVAGERTLRLIDGLREWARLATAEIHPQPVALAQILQEARSQAALREPPPAGHRVDWRLAEFPVVRGDALMLRRALVELLGNALKFSAGRELAVIEVGWQPLPGAGLRIWVRDNGVGFDRRGLGSLFAPCRRLHLPREFGGEGLGLAIVRAVAERHGGTVDADTLEGEWAEFGFSLPA
jgi:signal transduction histidine kinase